MRDLWCRRDRSRRSAAAGVAVLSVIGLVSAVSRPMRGRLEGLLQVVPFLVPLPMMFLGIITASLQAFIFVMLTMIYLGGAVEADEHGHGEAHGHEAAHRVETVAA